MSKVLKKVASVALPVVGNLVAPGIGGVVGGAAGGLIGGGGLKGALLGGVGGALTGYAPSIGGAINDTLGLGLTGSGAISALGAGVGGAGLGALSGGGLQGALLGGLTSATQGYLGNGGLNDLGITGQGSLLGSTAGSPLDGGVGPTQGSGVLGAAGRTLSSATSNLPGLTASGAGASGGSMSSYGSGIGNLISGYTSTKANNDAEKALLAAQGQARSDFANANAQSQALYQPFLNAKFDPGDLTQDPGYQFQLQQGQQALDRAQSARGGLFSGAALKAAQDYGQGLASTTYNNAYQRYLQQQGQNFAAAQGAAGLNTNLGTMLAKSDDTIGDIRATTGVNNSNVVNKTLSGLFGNGAFGNTGNSLNSSSLAQLLAAYNNSKSAFA